MSVAVVTDSTASIPADVANEHGITVVPLQVVIGATAYDEGVEEGAGPEQLAEALQQWTPVSTSRPSPERLGQVYRQLADDGAEEIIAVHLSGDLSGTVESALLAAERSPVPVRVVDSRQVGMGTGYAVLTAAEALRDGGSAADAVAAAERRAAATTSLFYVDTLEYLRRGGRVGALGALVGSALAVKPILSVSEGRVGPLEKVRTASRALARLEELAVEAAGAGPVDVAVSHLASPDRAASLATKLTERLADGLEGREVVLGEIGAVLGAHVGPGMVAVVVAPR